jgi:predicted dehydrogenase
MGGLMTEIHKEVMLNLGFLGLGWIGKNRLEALLDPMLVENVHLYDPDLASIEAVLGSVPMAKIQQSYQEMLNEDLDGVVIATPSAMHAKQAIQAMEKGMAVFCQKPLGRNLAETRAVVQVAQKLNKLLFVDYSYRYTAAVQSLKQLIKGKRIGKIYAVETVFHNAYGPDKSWFYDPELAGGGCLIDLGSHLIDMVLYLLDFPSIEVRYANLLNQGKQNKTVGAVEDFAEAQLSTATGISIRLACSWKLPVGKDAEIYFKVYGTEGGASFHNLGGSFYDFQTDVFSQNTTETFVTPPDDWGGRAIQHWADELAKKNEFKEANYQLLKVASILDDIYKFTGR